MTLSTYSDREFIVTIKNQIDFDNYLTYLQSFPLELELQPFGYDTTETTTTIAKEYVTATGEDITLNNTTTVPLEIDLKGNTYQEGTPTPDTPQEVQVVTGGQNIKIQNANVLPIFDNETTFNGVTCKITNGHIKLTGQVSSGYVWVKFTNGIDFADNTPHPSSKPNWFNQDLLVGGNYTFKAFGTTTKTISWVEKNVDNRQNLLSAGTDVSVTKDLTNTTMSCIAMYLGGTGTQINEEFDLEAVKGTTAPTTYTPHQEQNYEINLGTLELCKIGTYQDYIYKSGADWKIHREIEKHTYIGSEAENWSKYTSTDSQGNTYGFSINLPNTPLQVTNVSNFALSNYFRQNNRNAISVIDTRGIYLGSGDTLFLKIDQSLVSGGTDTNFKTWLSTHNTNVYYVLATPTDETITNAELIEQLNDILNAVSYEDQTNINQENDNLPFILDVSALKKGTDKAVINNSGNVEVAPIITVGSQGTLTVNGYSIETTEDNITIDCELMECYNGTIAKNNKVILSEFPVLSVGNNNVVAQTANNITIKHKRGWL